MEYLGINPLWVFAFPLVGVVGYILVFIQHHKAAKAAAKAKPVDEKPVTEYDLDA